MATEHDVRQIALALPATSERPSYGTPGFRVKDRLFARLHELPGTLVVWVADMGEKDALLTGEPDTFFETPHYDGYPMVLVRLGAIGAEELSDVVVESWRARAPRRLLAEFDAAQPPPDPRPAPPKVRKKRDRALRRASASPDH